MIFFFIFILSHFCYFQKCNEQEVSEGKVYVSLSFQRDKSLSSSQLGIVARGRYNDWNRKLRAFILSCKQMIEQTGNKAWPWWCIPPARPHLLILLKIWIIYKYICTWVYTCEYINYDWLWIFSHLPGVWLTKETYSYFLECEINDEVSRDIDR